jgi:predicted nucleic acid-binding protein
MNAIIDSSVIISLHTLEMFNYLNLIFEKVLMPTNVEREFIESENESVKSQRLKIISHYLENNYWFSQCQIFDPNTVNFYIKYFKEKNPKKNHIGESEVLAQNESIGSDNILLLDDSEARKIAQNKNYTYNGTLFILAVFDIYFKISPYKKNVGILKSKIKFRSKDNIEKEVYLKVKEKHNKGFPIF